MLHLIPASLHRALYRLAHGVRRRWWRIRKIPRRGVVVAGFNEAGQILLLRQSYGDPGWVAPSGGIEKGEDPEQAAVRECKEETGLILHEVALAAISQETIHGAPHTVYIFTGRLTGIPLPDGREIVEARYFDLKCLPRDSRNRLSLRLTLAGIAHSSESCITGG